MMDGSERINTVMTPQTFHDLAQTVETELPPGVARVDRRRVQRYDTGEFLTRLILAGLPREDDGPLDLASLSPKPQEARLRPPNSGADART
jgi:hypothetical protein